MLCGVFALAMRKISSRLVLWLPPGTQNETCGTDQSQLDLYLNTEM